MTLLDKHRIDLHGTLSAGKDCANDVNCIFEGTVSLGNNVKIGAGCLLKDVTIADYLLQLNLIRFWRDATIASGGVVAISPYARLRPGTRFGRRYSYRVILSKLKAQSALVQKVNHLTYIGDMKLAVK